MIPGIYNITAYRNDTLVLSFALLDSASQPIDLSSAVVKIQVRDKPDGEILWELTEGDGITVGGTGNNVVNISRVCDINGCGSYYYDLQVTDSGVVSTYVKGAFTVQKDITK